MRVSDLWDRLQDELFDGAARVLHSAEWSILFSGHPGRRGFRWWKSFSVVLNPLQLVGDLVVHDVRVGEDQGFRLVGDDVICFVEAANSESGLLEVGIMLDLDVGLTRRCTLVPELGEHQPNPPTARRLHLPIARPLPLVDHLLPFGGRC